MQPIHLPGVEIVHADAHLRKPLQLEGDKPSITGCTERKDSAGGESKVSPVTAPTSVGKSGDGIIITHFPPEHEPHHLIKFWRTIADYLSERQCDALQYECKLLARGLATRVPAWVVVGDGGYPSLEVAMTAFERFRASNPQRRFEIRLPDNGAYATGWDVLGPFGDNVPGVIGGGDFRGLQLDGEDRWNGLRIVTPEVVVVYGEGSRYSVVIKGGRTTIGYDAFAWCTGLTSLTFPEGLTTIEERAFYECTGLTSVTFPAGLTTIGERAFMGCTGLASVTFPEGLTTVTFNEITAETEIPATDIQTAAEASDHFIIIRTPRYRRPSSSAAARRGRRVRGRGSRWCHWCH